MVDCKVGCRGFFTWQRFAASRADAIYVSIPLGMTTRRREAMDGKAMTIDEIIDNFSLLDEWDDRYRYVIELGRALPPLDERDRNDANKVQGCASQVWLATTVAARTAPAARCSLSRATAMPISCAG